MNQEKKIFLSIEMLLELTGLEPGIINPPWPEFQRKNQVKIGRLNQES